jgi:hypothetical protein
VFLPTFSSELSSKSSKFPHEIVRDKY